MAKRKFNREFKISAVKLAGTAQVKGSQLLQANGVFRTFGEVLA